jgi:hypothetical protein
MRLEPGDEPAAELLHGSQAAPAFGEQAAQRRLGVDPGLGVGVAHVAGAVRRRVGGERGEARGQRVHERPRHGLHEGLRRALGERRPAAAGRHGEHLAGLQRHRRRLGPTRLHARRAGFREGLGAVGLHGQDQRAAGRVGVGERAADGARDARRRHQLDPAGEQVDAGAHVVAEVGREHRPAVRAERHPDAGGKLHPQQPRARPRGQQVAGLQPHAFGQGETGAVTQQRGVAVQHGHQGRARGGAGREGAAGQQGGQEGAEAKRWHGADYHQLGRQRGVTFDALRRGAALQPRRFSAR